MTHAKFEKKKKGREGKGFQIQQMATWKSHLSKLQDMEVVFISEYLCLIGCGRFMHFRQFS